MKDMRTSIARLLVSGILASAAFGTAEAGVYFRYVTPDGDFGNDGNSWATAKRNIQDAIDDVASKLGTSDSACIFVAEGTYKPTKSTETNGSVVTSSFQIPAGVHIYGGFVPDLSAEGVINSTQAKALIASRETVSTPVGTYMAKKTILSGDVTSNEATFTWNDSKHRYQTSFSGNCYHVVTFATNGFTADYNGTSRANAAQISGVDRHAVLDGVVVKDGYAFNSNINTISHNAFGGGIYMVKNAIVRNCEVYHCEASRDGGGIYMDGGGRVENCYVHDCQAVGVSSTTGIGGGISANQGGVITKSAVINNVARCGGGIGFYYDKNRDNAKLDGQYDMAASASLVAQNVATVEAGGVYLYTGGLLNGMTVVNNITYGTGVTIGGIVSGRSGGIYVRDHAAVYNTVIWGNRTSANNTNNVQFGSSRSGTAANLKPVLEYVALSQADYADWSGVKKVSISKLSSSNTNTTGTTNSMVKYPQFKNPATTVGHVDDESGTDMASNTYFKNVDWTPSSASGLCFAGLQLIDVSSTVHPVTLAGLTSDIVDKEYNPRCVLGAYVAEKETPVPATVNGVTTLFVDPNRSSNDTYSKPGSSWDDPMDNLVDALEYFRTNSIAGQVCVKEGTLSTASRSNFGRMRATTVQMVSNVSVYGGYSSSLSGTDLSLRNPVDYPTVITGQVSNDSYSTNVAHLVTFSGVTGAVLDGFQLRWGNASSTVLAKTLNLNTNGGGIFINNSTDLQIRNTLVANCAGWNGAAVFGSGSSAASATFTNCIFHNNQACGAFGEETASNNLNGGIVYAGQNTTFTIDHCDFLRNVGYGLVISESNASAKLTNSIFFANMDAAYADTKNYPTKALTAIYGTISKVTGHNNVFDECTTVLADTVESDNDDVIRASLGSAVLGMNESSKLEYARFVNPTRNSGVSTGSDVTYYGRETSFIPSDMNPAVNAASTEGVDHFSSLSDGSWGYDMSLHTPRDYGGLPDAGALENGLATASSATQPSYGSTIYVREYLNADGTVNYTEGGNGMSWATAINGNAWYTDKGVLIGAPPVDYTTKLTNPDFTTSTAWSGTSATINTAYGVAEIWDVSDVDINQTVKNLPNGYYRLTCQAFYRYATGQNTNSAALNAYQNGTDVKYAYLYANDQKTKIMSIAEELDAYASYHIGDADWTGSNSGLPQTLVTAALCFNDGLYSDNEVWVEVTNGTLKLGISKSGTYSMDWLVFSNFRLYYYGAERQEVGISGLQYAVDAAHASMKPNFKERTTTQTESSSGNTSTTTVKTYYDFTPTDSHPEVSVWVGAGTYTNPEGFKIRNHVKVYGGFPKTGNPGMNERHPQLTEGVPLSAANQLLGLKVADYETILQTNKSIAERDSCKRSVNVLMHPYECRVTNYDDRNEFRSRVVYEGAEWDGFTMRYGFKEGVVRWSSGGRRNGGPGVSMYENFVLRNCIVRDNLLGDYSSDRSSVGRGGGIYCDGGTVENCYVMDNTAKCSNGNENYGGGIYMIRGTMFNTVVTGNSVPDGGGIGNAVYFESAVFYNNTIANNTGGQSTIGVYTASAGSANLTVYNSIIMCGSYPALVLASGNIPASFDHCFIQSSDACSNMTNGNYKVLTRNACQFYPSTDATTRNPFALDYNTAVKNYDYRIELKEQYSCVNEGTENLGTDKETGETVVLPSSDMDYTDRIQDCKVDIGAYEYNGSADISPDLTTAKDTAIYYVTEEGFGTTQAYDPANAACAAKLQKVLDAAGRYKYLNKKITVIVKLAGADATKWSDFAAGEKAAFKYYPCRTTDEDNDNVRLWSIMVPRGVEVWGGYSVEDVLTETTNDKIAPCFSDDERSVMYHPTYLQTEYDNDDLNETVRGYHVVTFTDLLYDKNGYPFLVGDTVSTFGSSHYSVGKTYQDSQLKHIDNTTDRAVLDGLFLVGGQADGESYSATSGTVNVNQYGGAAVVTDYAHVRNCIVKNNTATYGGALALQKNALVSGSLIVDNEAEYGGGIYIVENEVQMSDGVNNTVAKDAKTDRFVVDSLAHVYTTTIVKNAGNMQGGGIWFSNDATEPNVRINSTAVWQNDSPDQANVAGQTAPSMPEGTVLSSFDWYPFSYSAVQNLRLPGLNNISVEMNNPNGTRFAKDSKTDASVYNDFTIASDTTQISYYGLTEISSLCRAGMPYSDYETLVKNQGLALRDYNKWRRDTISAGEARTDLDIGARAYPSAVITDESNIFLRLFVAQSEDIDMTAYNVMQQWSKTARPGTSNYVYGLLGSSFAYPFQNLDDALKYIETVRKSTQWKDKANNLRFEICMARGEYYPQRDMQGNYSHSLDNTFLVPEGVTIVGGFDCSDFYGQYWQPSGKVASAYTTELNDNQVFFGGGTAINRENTVSIGSEAVTILQMPLDTMSAARPLVDKNMNNILEPWEFLYETTLSGNTDNLQNSGVYHVVSVAPYAPGTGQLPTAKWVNPDYVTNTQAEGYGKAPHEQGQPVILDGVTVSGGYAWKYANGSVNDRGVYSYYKGGGLLVSGNWYCADVDGTHDNFYHSGVTDPVGYRDIPVYLRHTIFINNVGGVGGAVSTDGSLYIYGSVFNQNKASRHKDEKMQWTDPNTGNPEESNLEYPGIGGAIHFNSTLEAYNTIFANNEAEDDLSKKSDTLTCRNYADFVNTDPGRNLYAGAGGVLAGGYNSRMKILNCDFVNNRASIYPAIFTMNPNRSQDPDALTESEYNLLVNNVFWGNGIHPDVKKQGFAQGLAINYGNTASVETSGKMKGRYSAMLDKAPQSQDDLDDNFNETLWFSAYESGLGKTHANGQDFRQMAYSADTYIGKSFRDYYNSRYSDKGAYAVQNGNILLSSENYDLEGPNFSNPSERAGFDGYTEDADWSRSRINNLTDNGSGMLKQNVTNTGTTYVCDWKVADDGTYEGSGSYHTSHYQTESNIDNTAIGGELYMETSSGTALTRLASDPNPNVENAYIDLGVYEYPHTQLVWGVDGDQVDVLWVATQEKIENGDPNGKTWYTPTSDLQRAIETLLSSHNGHRKEIRITNGEYTPSTLSPSGHNAFYINTGMLAKKSVLLPASYYTDKTTSEFSIDDYGVRSLTIKGGYSKDLFEQYDPDLYPVILRQKNRTDATGDKWDYLFYIDDATQRYGQSEGDDLGAFSSANLTAAYTDKKVTTVPVQIDGVTLVNNQANSNTRGTAICYADQLDTIVGTDGKTYVYQASAPETANITVSAAEYAEMSATDKSYDRMFYTDDTYSIRSDNPTEFVHYYRTVTNPAKLVITKTKVMNSGTQSDYAQDNTSSAVYIGKYGGDALVYNSVFHSNWGNPIEAYNTRTVNNTVALNKGAWVLTNLGDNSISLPETDGGKGSGPMLAPAADRTASNYTLVETKSDLRKSNILNSVLWRNRPVETSASEVTYMPQFSLAGYVSDSHASSVDIFRRNAYTDHVNGVAQITEGSNYLDGSEIALNLWNTHLSDDNEDISYGPHFLQPSVDATSVDDIEARDFSLQPSIRIVNRGDTTIYANQVYDMAWIPTTELDFLGQPRVVSISIEKGAIEYQQPLSRVIYVKAGEGGLDGDGTNWNKAITGTNIQNAIDLAAIYCAVNPAVTDEEGNVTDLNESYVIVKGNSNSPLNKATIRAGVNLIGSSTGQDTVRYTLNEDGSFNYSEHIAEDIRKIRDARTGLVGPGVASSVIPSIATNDEVYATDRPTSIDGFVITNTNGSTVTPVTSPVLSIKPNVTLETDTSALPPVAVSNCVVADNQADPSASFNMVEIDNALIYEVLMRDNTVGAENYVLKLGSNGYGVNLTVEGLTNDAAGRTLMASEAGAPTLTDNYNGNGHLWYSIYNYSGYAPDENTLSKYNYAIDGYPNLNYQLTEHSHNIDFCPVVNPMESNNYNGGRTRNLVQFINYDTDIDLLGNPRVLNTAQHKTDNVYLDRGAFETWTIGNGTKALNVATDVVTTHYKGNYYPHDGSVVYVMEGSNFVTAAHELKPGYLLVKKGASLYGHGQTVKASYVALERDVKASGSVVAVPYVMDYAADAEFGTYDAKTGVLTLHDDDATAAMRYNGKMRSGTRYRVLDAASSCWSALGTDKAETNEGVFFTAGKDTTYRFTAKAAWNTNIYVEEFERDASGELIGVKPVTLTVHNLEDEDGFGNMTAEENMGWNCFGIPYLVSEYKPYTMAATDHATATPQEYQMHLPKKLWLYYDGAQTPDASLKAETDGGHYAGYDINKSGFYCVNSWDETAAAWHLPSTDTPALWMGEGMFAQTASYTDEALNFYYPVFSGTVGSAPADRMLTRIYIEDGSEEDDEPTGPDLNNTVYDLQGRRVQTPSNHGIYIVNGRKVCL